MHIHFLAIGGAGISPLALMAKQAGFSVSGSDKQDSENIQYLRQKGITDIDLGDQQDFFNEMHQKLPIDWLVYSSAVSFEDPGNEVIAQAQKLNIKTSKRDQFINYLLEELNLKMVAIAGTHGKTTTTAIIVWVLKSLGLDISYLLAAKVDFAPMAEYNPSSTHLVYEADEFDHNFLSFYPDYSLISGIGYDHHEIYPTFESYKEAFKTFITQSKNVFIWEEDYNLLSLNSKLRILDQTNSDIDKIKLIGKYNRRDAYLVINAVHQLYPNYSLAKLNQVVSLFPGLHRRMEQIIPNLYSDYAHTPEKIRAALNVASEMVQSTGQKIVVVYEPLTNRRQKYIKEAYRSCFKEASKIYWIDSYLAREDPNETILEPKELITYLPHPELAQPAHMDQALVDTIKQDLKDGQMVLVLSGGGGNSLDSFIRNKFNP